ncbi:MAG TPA: ABC transporter ATP-binding protein, partial [Solirubrobacteraceae bacterium]|nr:ABC transporter ATP-binding protein [Solirubrobacteraceae bacterium]
MSRAARPGGAGGLLRASLRGRFHQLLLFAFWSAVEALPVALSGRLIALALDRGFLAGRGGAGFGFLALFGLTVLAGSWGTREAFLRLAVVIEPFRDELVRRAVGGSLRRSARAGAPPDSAAVARLTQQVEIVREAYASVLLVAQGFLVTAGAALVGLATLVPGATVLVLAPLGLSLGVFVLALPRLAARQRESILADEALAEASASGIGGLRDVVACGGEDAAMQAIGGRVREQARASTRVARMSALRTLIVALGGWVPVVLVLLAASRLQRDGAATGAIIGVLTYVLRGVQPALQQLVAGIGSTGLWLLVTLRRIVETTAPDEPVRAAASPSVPRDGSLRLRDVTFAYGPAADPVIDGLDLDLRDGEHLAIVGPSGAGKSTLANLAAGLLAPQQGSILLGGVPVAAVDPAALGRHRVLIPQEAYVLCATVRENLLYLAPGASPGRVADALELLGAAALVDRLGGLDAVVTPDALSAGERQ